MKKPSPTPETPPVEDPIISQHHDGLATLAKEIDSLSQLSDRWSQLTVELAEAERVLESTASDLVSGQADDASFTAESDKLAALEARLRVVKKLAAAQGTGLQGHLEKDIAATEFLARIWLDHRLLSETNALLLTVNETRRGAVKESAVALALVGLAYEQSQNELGSCAPVSWLWQRPIELESSSQKTIESQRLKIADPLYRPVDPFETVSALLAAAKAQQTRWQTVLAAAARDASFTPPNSYTEPKIEPWVPPAHLAGVTSGPPSTPGVENFGTPQVKMVWSESDLAVPPWEQKSA